MAIEIGKVKDVEQNEDGTLDYTLSIGDQTFKVKGCYFKDVSIPGEIPVHNAEMLADISSTVNFSMGVSFKDFEDPEKAKELFETLPAEDAEKEFDVDLVIGDEVVGTHTLTYSEITDALKADKEDGDTGC